MLDELELLISIYPDSNVGYGPSQTTFQPELQTDQIKWDDEKEKYVVLSPLNFRIHFETLIEPRYDEPPETRGVSFPMRCWWTLVDQFEKNAWNVGQSKLDGERFLLGCLDQLRDCYESTGMLPRKVVVLLCINIILNHLKVIWYRLRLRVPPNGLLHMQGGKADVGGVTKLAYPMTFSGDILVREMPIKVGHVGSERDIVPRLTLHPSLILPSPSNSKAERFTSTRR